MHRDTPRDTPPFASRLPRRTPLGDRCSAFMSAKTGDSVSSCFYRVAAELAGVVLTKPELEVRKLRPASVIELLARRPRYPPCPGALQETVTHQRT